MGDSASGVETQRMRAAIASRLFNEPPPRIGRFIVAERLGRGAMGAVYAAYDPDLDRKIALKLLPRVGGKGDRQRTATARLVREAKAMAKLSHPNVVTVHEVGVHAEQVFIAMEYVGGGTLSDAVRDQPPARVLGLLLQAGRGLAAAHAAGLVHRDFKPANVLVGDDGRVRVADFGLARPPSSDETNSGAALPAADVATTIPENDRRITGEVKLAAQLTVTGEVVGTPAYMAPEQFEGTTDARSDQFSYCVTLYEALYGERPFVGRSVEELVAALIHGGPPDPPARAGVPGSVRRALLRGLAIDPAARWPSMTRLISVLAAAQRRRRRQAGYAAAGLLAVAGVGVGYVVAGDEAPSACQPPVADLAGVWDEPRQQEIGDAIAATGVPFGEETWTRAKFGLDAYAQSWLEGHREACEATRVHGLQSEALLDLRAGCLRRRLDDLRAVSDRLVAIEAADVQRVGAAVRGLAPISSCRDVEHLEGEGQLPDDPEQREAVRTVERELSGARAALMLGDREEAAEGFGEVLARARELDHPPLLAEALLRSAIVAGLRGEHISSETLFLEAINVAAGAHADRVAAEAWQQLIYEVGYRSNDFERALQWVPAAEAAVVRAGDPALLRARLYMNVGSVRRRAGDPAGSVEEHGKALTVLEQASATDEMIAVHAHMNIANALSQLRRSDEALTHLEEAAVLLDAALGPSHPTMGDLHNNAGATLSALGRQEEALARLERALEIREGAYGPGSRQVADTLTNVGSIEQRLGRYAEAAEHHERALAIARALPGDHGSMLGAILNNLANTYDDLDRLEEARRLHEEALVERSKALGPDHPNVSMSHGNLGHVLDRLGRHEEGIEHQRRAIEIVEQRFGAEDPRLLIPLRHLGEAQIRNGEPSSAVVTLERAAALIRAEADPHDAALVRFYLAKALWASGQDKQRAVELGTRARDALAESTGQGGEMFSRVDRWLNEITRSRAGPAR